MHVWHQIYKYLGASNHWRRINSPDFEGPCHYYHPKPHKVRALEELLGSINFYHRFIPNADTPLRPLYCALKGKPQCLVCYNDMTNAYTSAISLLASATLLAHPRFDVPNAVNSDASDIGNGTVFEQFVEGVWQPLAFLASNSVNQNASIVHLTKNC